MDNKESRYKNILIRDEFLKVYFKQMGIIDEINVERFSDIFDLKRAEVGLRFFFLIIKTRFSSNEVENKYFSFDSIERIEKQNQDLINRYNLGIIVSIYNIVL